MPRRLVDRLVLLAFMIVVLISLAFAFRQPGALDTAADVEQDPYEAETSSKFE